MKLTRYTDYAMRVLIYLGTRGGELSSIAEIARVYDISQNNLMKVVQELGHLGVVETVRGRHGGIRLGRAAERINVGEVVRHTESGFELVDCSSCQIAGPCTLPAVLQEATQAFLAVLDRYTVADLVGNRDHLQRMFWLHSEPVAGGQ